MSTTTYLEIEDRYVPTSENTDIEVSIAIGDGQKGAYLIFLDQVLKGANKKAIMGKPADVLNKTTVISATVTDVLDETNWTSVTITVSQGATTKVYGPYSKQVAANFDTVVYIIKISNAHE